MSNFTDQNNSYRGVDRRSSKDRRSGIERRNLVRFESIGCDRRRKDLRREEDVFWRSV